MATFMADVMAATQANKDKMKQSNLLFHASGELRKSRTRYLYIRENMTRSQLWDITHYLRFSISQRARQKFSLGLMGFPDLLSKFKNSLRIT